VELRELRIFLALAEELHFRQTGETSGPRCAGSVSGCSSGLAYGHPHLGRLLNSSGRWRLTSRA
jgi:hypothetical protein